jgi:hypothetical protein
LVKEHRPEATVGKSQTDSEAQKGGVNAGAASAETQAQTAQTDSVEETTTESVLSCEDTQCTYHLDKTEKQETARMKEEGSVGRGGEGETEQQANSAEQSEKQGLDRDEPQHSSDGEQAGQAPDGERQSISTEQDGVMDGEEVDQSASADATDSGQDGDVLSADEVGEATGQGADGGGQSGDRLDATDVGPDAEEATEEAEEAAKNQQQKNNW